MTNSLASSGKQEINRYDMKAAIAGCGGIFTMHARSLEALGITITAVCDIKRERAEAQAETFHCRAYTDLDEMLSDGGFDILHICLPHYLHAPAAIKAAEKGFHVLTEKPMSIHLADAENMIAAAKQNHVRLGVIFQNRYNPGSVLIKSRLDSGALGKIKSGWLRVTWFRSPEYYTESGWRGKWDTEGGGVIINQSIHTFDLMNYFMGGKPLYAEAVAVNRKHPMIEVEDVAEGVIGYADRVYASFYVNTIHPYDAPVMLELVCEKGTVTLTGERAVIRYMDGQEEAADQNSAPIDGDASSFSLKGKNTSFFTGKAYWGISHVRQIHAFYESLAKGEEPVINGEAALKTQRLICGIYESARVGKRVVF